MSPPFGREHVSSQRAISLPSSPHQFASQTPERSGGANCAQNDEMVLTWNKVLESPLFHNKPLLPYEEWNIDFSELTVRTRVGIGMYPLPPPPTHPTPPPSYFGQLTSICSRG